MQTRRVSFFGFGRNEGFAFLPAEKEKEYATKSIFPVKCVCVGGGGLFSSVLRMMGYHGGVRMLN